MLSNQFLVLILALACVPLLTDARQTRADTPEKAPPHVYVDVGACPFECCTYRQWTVEKSTTLVDRPHGTRVIAKLSKGDVVIGVTGEVISTPLPVKADRDVPETPIKKGDIFYVLHYDGEGYWKVWLRGKLEQVHESVVKMPEPKSEWWVKIKDSHGNVGWSLSHRNFAHQDACE